MTFSINLALRVEEYGSGLFTFDFFFILSSSNRWIYVLLGVVIAGISREMKIWVVDVVEEW